MPDEGLERLTGGRQQVMKELPEDLSVLDQEGLTEARSSRDERVTRLFRRWPSLSEREMRELKLLYGERMRLAKYVGRLRRLGPMRGRERAADMKKATPR
jgi:hypothetical protein